MKLIMEDLLQSVYGLEPVPYWGNDVPVAVVRKLIDEAQRVSFERAIHLVKQSHPTCFERNVETGYCVGCATTGYLIMVMRNDIAKESK